MSLDFTQEQIERELADLLPHGMREGIAKGTGIYAKIVDAFFNPHDERKSPHFSVLHIQAVVDALDPETGDALWAKLTELREASMARPVKAARLDTDHELGCLSKEFADIVVAKCDGQPINVLLREIADAQRQLQKYKESVFDTLTGTFSGRVN